MKIKTERTKMDLGGYAKYESTVTLTLRHSHRISPKQTSDSLLQEKYKNAFKDGMVIKAHSLTSETAVVDIMGLMMPESCHFRKC